MSSCLDINDLDPGPRRELGVEPEHVDGKGHLVDDALAGAVSAAEKLQIVDGVVLPVSVDVMHGFLGEQRAPNVPFHDVAVLHDGVFLASNQRGHRNPNIAVAFDVPAVFAAFKTGKSHRSLVACLACGAAKFLLRIVFCMPGRSLVLPSRYFLSAFETIEGLIGFGLYSSRSSGALPGAVQGIATIHSDASVNCPKCSGKRHTAVLTDKGLHFRWFSRHGVLLSFGDIEHASALPFCQAIGA